MEGARDCNRLFTAHGMGAFYIQAAVLFATSLVMCVTGELSHIIFGVVSGACFFVPGLKYFRQRGRG